MPNKHICFVNYQVGHLLGLGRGVAGGAESQVMMMARALADKGYKVSIITELDKSNPIIQKWGVHWHHVAFDYLGGSKKQLPENWFQLCSKIQSLRPDIIHIKHPRHLLMPLGILARTIGAKLFFHAAIDKDFDQESLKNEPPLARWLYDSGLKLTTGIIAQTKFQEAQINRLKKYRVDVVSNIFESPNAKTSTADFHKREFFLWVGSNSERKRPQIFIELAKQLPSLEFLMVYAQGDGTGNINQDHIPLNLKLVSQLPRHQLFDYYGRSHALISTSRLEGFPNVFLESWSMGTPVLSVDVDPDDVIKNHQLGNVVGSASDLISLCQSYQEDMKKLEIQGRNGLAYVQNYHGAKLVVEQLERAFFN